MCLKVQLKILTYFGIFFFLLSLLVFAVEDILNTSGTLEVIIEILSFSFKNQSEI